MTIKDDAILIGAGLIAAVAGYIYLRNATPLKDVLSGEMGEKVGEKFFTIKINDDASNISGNYEIGTQLSDVFFPHNTINVEQSDIGFSRIGLTTASYAALVHNIGLEKAMIIVKKLTIKDYQSLTANELAALYSINWSLNCTTTAITKI